MEAVAALSSGGYLAIGETLADCRAMSVAWSSPDGLAWERIAGIPDLGPVGLLAVEDDQVVASSSCLEPGCASLFTSRDLSRWTEVPGPADIGVQALAIVDRSAIVAGPGAPMSPTTAEAPVRWLDGILGSTPAQASWTPVQGIDWTGVGSPSALDLAVTSDRIVLLGFGEATFGFVGR
jgi:hypothetical protein